MHAPSIAEAKRLSAGLEKAVFETLEVDDVDDMAFDVVLLSEVLEHVEKPDKLLAESLKKMKSGGLMIVTVPNGYGEFEWDSWMFSRLGLERLVEKYETRRTDSRRPGPIASTENHDNRHIQFFTLRRLRKMFAEAGLVIERAAGSTVFGGPFAGHTLARSSRFISWNASAADRLPISMASGWYFALRRSGPR
jgi:SAM-dependent methyltransferase